MERTCDFLILGSGLAAFAAALELESSGKEILIVASSSGATGMSSGAWDLADPGLGGRPLAWRRVSSLQDRIERILFEQPHHPYTIFNRGILGMQLTELLHGCLERAAKALALPYRFTGRYPLALLNPLGTIKLTDAAQASIAAGDLNQLDRARILLVGFEGFPEFSVRWICQSLLEQQELQPHCSVEFAGPLEMKVPGVMNHHSLTAFEIAQALDQEKHFVSFGNELVNYLQSKVYTHILLPPVLGVENNPKIIEALRSITGLEVAESLAIPMSIPGLRLSRAIAAYAEQHRMKVINGKAVEYGYSGRKLNWIEISQGQERLRIHAKGVILATGKYVGGGMRRRQKPEESLFGLPIFHDGVSLDEREGFQWTEGRAKQTQPFLRAGVRVNSSAQPLNDRGEVVFDNLVAAGTLLSGFDPSHDRCSSGVCLLSGTIGAKTLRASLS